MSILLEYDRATLEKVRGKLGWLSDQLRSNDVARLAAQSAITAIRFRTQAMHKDVNGTPFESYTQGYLNWLNNSRFGVKPVNLTLTGRMLNSMGFRIVGRGDGREAIIFFEGKKQQDKARGNIIKRKFFGIGQAEERAIGRVVSDYIKKRVDKL